MRIIVGVGGILWFCMAACVGDDPVGSVPAGSSSGGPDSGLGGSGGVGPNDPDASQPDGAVDPQLLRAVSVSAGASHTCAVLEGGGVACWGSNANGELGSPTSTIASSSLPLRVVLPARAMQVTAGNRFTCALLETGAVACWGSNESGQLGRLPLGPTGGVETLPPPPANPRGPWQAPVSLTAGDSHVCATVPGGVHDTTDLPMNPVWCWGKNASRQLMVRTEAMGPSATPQLARLTGNEEWPYPFISAVAGSDFMCAINFGGFAGTTLYPTVMCWGARGTRQLGAAVLENSPYGVPAAGGAEGAGLANPRLLAAGAQHACTIADKSGGSALYCWGDATRGAMGTLSSTAADGVAFRVDSSEANNITHLAAGGNDTCAVESGRVECMGANQSGQLGDGTVDSEPRITWSTVDVPPTVSSLSVGGEHVCAVFGGAAGQPGDVRCWGANRAGQLGDGVDLNVGYTDVPGQTFIRATPVSVRAARP